MNCKKAIGEIEFDATMNDSLCGQCKVEYTESCNLIKSRIKIAWVV